MPCRYFLLTQWIGVENQWNRWNDQNKQTVGRSEIIGMADSVRRREIIATEKPTD